MLRILHGNNEGGVTITTPSPEALKFATIYEIAEKDVEPNNPYWIIDDADMPPDDEHRNAWEISDTIGEPDGFGGESSEFPEALLNKYYEMIGHKV